MLTVNRTIALAALFLGLLPPIAAAQVKPALPSGDEILQWIDTIDRQGIRLPGYPANDWIETWARDQFHGFGIEQVRLEPFQVMRWEPGRWSLTVWPQGRADEAVILPAWPVPLSAPAEALVGELQLIGPERAPQPGRIAVESYRLLEFAQAEMRDTVARWHHDPDGDFQNLTQVVPMGARFQHVMDPAAAAGAAAWIGILDFPWDEDRYFVPYDAKARDIPGLYLSRSNGARLLALLEAGPVEARIAVQSRREPDVSHNVVATLPGRSEQWIMIGSHHDGPWNSAVEDASGVALVLAQAKYWAQVPAAQRPHNLMFVLQGGHMSGGAGLHHTARTYAERLRHDTVAVIHLEHAAREARVENGRLRPTDKPEVRWWFTSYIPRLEEIVSRAICRQDLGRSLMMPPYGWPRPQAKRPPTDASLFFLTTPAVSFLPAPMYLFDPADRVNMIHEASLEPVTAAVIEMIEALGAETAAGLRTAEYQPPRPQALPGCPQLLQGD